MCTRRVMKRSRGFTLIELIMFIVIVGAALAGVLSVFTNSVRSSADPMIRKQMIAIAEALMSEAVLHPFTYCDPDDANVLYANAADTLAGNCATTPEVIGPELNETRISLATPVDNVNDYHAPVAAAATNVLGGAILAGYTSSIAITAVGGGAGSLATLPAGAVLQIVVTVARGGDNVVLTGYRFRHSPNAAG